MPTNAREMIQLYDELKQDALKSSLQIDFAALQDNDFDVDAVIEKNTRDRQNYIIINFKLGGAKKTLRVPVKHTLIRNQQIEEIRDLVGDAITNEVIAVTLKRIVPQIIGVFQI